MSAQVFTGAPGRTRTCDARFRKLLQGVWAASGALSEHPWLAKLGKACPGWSSEKLREKPLKGSPGEDVEPRATSPRFRASCTVPFAREAPPLHFLSAVLIEDSYDFISEDQRDALAKRSDAFLGLSSATA